MYADYDDELGDMEQYEIECLRKEQQMQDEEDAAEEAAELERERLDRTRVVEDAKIACLERMHVLRRMGNSDPESTGQLANKALVQYLQAIGEDEIIKQWKLVSRYY